MEHESLEIDENTLNEIISKLIDEKIIEHKPTSQGFDSLFVASNLISTISTGSETHEKTSEHQTQVDVEDYGDI